MTNSKDQMTSNERLGAYFEGKEVDRLPAMPMIDSVGPRLMGKNYRFFNFAFCSKSVTISRLFKRTKE